MNRRIPLSLAGMLLLGAAPACSTSDGEANLGAEMPRSAGVDALVADGRLNVVNPVTQLDLDVAPSAVSAYEAMVAAKPEAAQGQPFKVTEPVASAHDHKPAAISDAFTLTLDLPKSDYVLGEPVILRATLTNVADTPMDVAPLLDTVFDRFKVRVQTPEGPRAYHNMVQACTLPSVAVRTLEPGESFSNDLRLIAPKGGWMFDLPGDYTIDATLMGMTDAGARVVAEPIDLTVLAGSANDQAIAAMIMDSQAALLLDWQDGDQFSRGQATLDTIVREYPESIHALYAGQVLGNMWSNDFYRTTGTRPADPIKALSYLEPTFRRLIEPGAPVVSWDVAASVAQLMTQNQLALGRVANARATVDRFDRAFGHDDAFAQALSDLKASVR